MEQVLEDELAVARVQVAGLKLPPLPPSLQAVVPVGVVGAPLVSVTVAVNVAILPAVTDAGLGDTLVVVVSKEEVVDCIASAITPKSASIAVPKESVAEERGFEVTSY